MKVVIYVHIIILNEQKELSYVLCWAEVIIYLVQKGNTTNVSPVLFKYESRARLRHTG